MGQAADIVPGKGATFADMFRVLHDPNSHVSRWMRTNGAGYIDETSATGEATFSSYMQPHPLEQRPQPLLDMANEYTEALLRKQEREQGMRNFATVLGILNTGEGDSLVDAFRPLLDNARRRNMAARGGKQYDGVTEPTGLMNNRNHLLGAWGRMVSFVSL